MTEEELRADLTKLRQGDRDAFERIYRGLSGGVYAALLRLTGDRQTAEDLLQETFLKLYREPPGEGVRRPRAYLFKMARNLALDELRRRREAEPLEGAERPAPAPDTDQRLDVEAALARLSEGDRLLVTLRLNGGLTFREAAAVLELPLGTALGRYYAAIGKLRDYLSD